MPSLENNLMVHETLSPMYDFHEALLLPRLYEARDQYFQSVSRSLFVRVTVSRPDPERLNATALKGSFDDSKTSKTFED